jgi:hypothetical protein
MAGNSLRSVSKPARLPEVVQLEQFQSCFIDERSYALCMEQFYATVLQEQKVVLMLDGERVLFAATPVEHPEEITGTEKVEVFQLMKMKKHFTSEGYQQFTMGVTNRIEENGPNVLLLDDERVLCRGLPKGSAMREFRRELVQRLIDNPDEFRTLVERLDNLEYSRKEVEIIDW